MSFKNVLQYGAMLVLSAAPLVAYGQFKAPTQEELSMTSDPKAPGAAAVYLYREETEEDDHHFRTLYVRIKVLTEKGKELATVHVGYERNFSFNTGTSDRDGENLVHDISIEHGHIEVGAISGRTIHPDGTVIPLTTTPADLMAESNAGNQMNNMTFNLPSVEVGSILEYRYQLRYDRFFTAPDWQIQQSYYVHKAHYTFLPSDAYNQTIANGSGSGGSYIVNEHGVKLEDILISSTLPAGKSVQPDPTGRYQLDLNDIPPIPEEVHAPPAESLTMHVNFYYAPSFDAKQYWHDEMHYWEKDVSAYTAATGAIKQAAADAVSPSDAPLDKARKLYALVQKFDNTSYSSNSGFSSFGQAVPPGSVESVLQKKSGNSEEIALLYLALARAAGLDARDERIASRNHRTFDATYLQNEQLDSIVIALNIDGKEIDVDPGAKMAPFQTLEWAHTGAGGVAIGTDGKVETVLTPLAEYKDNNTVRIGKLTIGADGAVSGALKVGFTGQEALHWRQLALRTSADEMKHRLESEIAHQVPDGVQVHIDHIAGVDDSAAQLVAVVQISGTLGSVAGKRLILPRLFFDSKATVLFPAEDARVLPVDMHYAAQEQEQITYLFPAGFTLADPPQDNKFSWENNATYSVKSKADAGSITTGRVLARAFTLLEAKDYGQLRDFYQKVATGDQQQLVLTAQ
jgi:transglutaminase-like putative cysteine protease